MNKESLAGVTAKIGNALRLMLLNDPLKTGYGALVGVFLYTVRGQLAKLPVIGELFNALNFASYSIGGVLIFRSEVFISKKRLDSVTITNLNTLKKIIKEGNFSDAEERQMYRDFTMVFLNNINTPELSDNRKVPE